MRAGLILAGLVGAALIGNAPAVIAEASAVPCEHRSAAHSAEHGGINADSAWHVAHGQLPTCDAGETTSPAPTPVPVQGDDQTDTDEKSRYCRHRWYC